MSDHERASERGAGAALEVEAEVRSLLEASGARPQVPPRDMARIRAAARDEWQAVVRARSRSRSTVAPLALAASLILALLAAWWWWRPQPAIPGAAVATLELARGEVLVDGRPATVDRLAAGSELATAPAGSGETPRAALRMAGGPSVRLDSGTRVRLRSAAELELVAGAVYVDSGALAPASGAIAIHTAWGDVREIGTQFEVRLENGEASRLRVRVREGAVAIERDGISHAASHGEQVTLYRDGTVERTAVAGHGEPWAWVLAAAPSLEIEGIRLARYLEWVERETGWRIDFAEPELAAVAAEIELHGTIDGVAPGESVESVLPSTGLAWRVAGGVLTVEGPVRTPR